jgi:hypothetical protein
VRLQTCRIVVRLPDFWSGIRSTDLRNKEPISALWNGLDVSGIFGVVVQRLSEFANRYPETAVEVDEGIAGPEAAAKFLAADDFSRGFEEDEEEPIGLLLQPDGSPVLEEFA